MSRSIEIIVDTHQMVIANFYTSLRTEVNITILNRLWRKLTT